MAFLLLLLALFVAAVAALALGLFGKRWHETEDGR